MNYTQIKNPIWANAEHTAINCDVNFDDLSEEFVAFTANPLDTINPASKEIFDKCVAGDYGTITEYVLIPQLTPAEIAEKKQAIIDTKASALAKLAALGLTQDEVKSLVG